MTSGLGVALLATACAMLTELQFGCRLGTRLFMYISGITVFAIVSATAGRVARSGLGEDEEVGARLGFLGRWSQAQPVRIVSAVWGCCSAYALTFFLLRVLIWWLSLVVAGSLAATILFGPYKVVSGLILLVPVAVETADPGSVISTADIAVLLGTAASLVILGPCSSCRHRWRGPDRPR